MLSDPKFLRDPRTCQTCGRLFNGRRNKRYCDSQCKSFHNNELARNRREIEKTVSKDLINNYRLLDSLLKQNNHESLTVRPEELESLGFNPGAESRKGLMNNLPVYGVGDIALRHDLTGSITIFRTPTPWNQ